MAPDGYITIPLQLRHGQMCAKHRTPTGSERNKLPRLFITSSDTWQPQMLNDEDSCTMNCEDITPVHGHIVQVPRDPKSDCANAEKACITKTSTNREKIEEEPDITALRHIGEVSIDDTTEVVPTSTKWGKFAYAFEVD